ncbi:hypothetical protein [Latilactobacillus sakei]|uniref:hypothetical protein n=1 Tax=Latilactobacillus sakei TaxID=1599 RepID=UPI000DC64A42|nr:hypothetical protein [Latilactobacillus sakei]SPS07207.1 hypothetical protein LAS9624_01457 [Latilactobacillus sakei]
MKFKRLDLSYRKMHRVIPLDEKTLIYSEGNSVGKSTLLRLLFYGIGYAIPGTYGLKFKEMSVKVFFEKDEKIYYTKRVDNYIELYCEDEFVESTNLTGNDDRWFAEIWGIQSARVLQNILGTIYMDQDKGWTLLNRGKVIGNIRFNIRDLLVGLSGNNESLNESLAVLDNQKKMLKQTRQLLDIVRSAANSTTSNIDLVDNIDSEELNKRFKNLTLKSRVLHNDFQKIDQNIRDQKGLLEYIDSLNIMIHDSGRNIIVSKKNLLHFEDNISYLKQKLAWLKGNIEMTTNELAVVKKKIAENTENLFSESDVIKRTLSDIAKIDINEATLEARENELFNSIMELNKVIEDEFTDSNELIVETRDWVNIFAKRLNVLDVVKDKRYIFTRDLKSISGTIYYKVVFSFKMAYVKIIEKYTGINLPIVLDSPSGREVTGRNISEVISILNDYFENNQIIIASINKYDLKDVSEIIMNKRIFEEDSVNSEGVTQDVLDL